MKILYSTAILCSLFLGACLSEEKETDSKSIQVSLKPESATEQASSAPQTTAAKETPPKEAKKPAVDPKVEIEKWNSYVDLGNAVENYFHQALYSYQEAYGHGPTYQPRDFYGLKESFSQTMSEATTLAKAINAALTKAAIPPHSSLDTAVTELGRNLQNLWGALMAARDLQAESSRDANFAAANQERAATLHKSIYDYYQQLNDAYLRFREILNSADAERRKKDIQNMATQGLKIRSFMLKAIDSAQALQTLLGQNNVSSATLHLLTLEDFNPLFSQFLLSADEFENALDNSGDDQADKENLAAEPLAAFRQQLTVVRAAAASLLVRHQLKTTAEEEPGAIMGTPEHFALELGRLIDLYNQAIDPTAQSDQPNDDDETGFFN